MKTPKITFLIVVLCLNFQFLRAQNTYQTIDASACKTLITEQSENPNFVIIDLRQPNYWTTEHVSGAINRNFYDGDFSQQLQALPRHKMYLIYCQGGGRSARTLSQMKDLNFEAVYEMSGGISAWKSQYETSYETFAKAMLVSYTDTIQGTSSSDTIRVKLTNRGNKTLAFDSIQFIDEHTIEHNFNEDMVLDGAEDYTFEMVRTPAYTADDSTMVTILTNGGSVEFSIKVYKDVIQSSSFESIAELLVFPNPASHFFSVKNTNGQTMRDIRLISMTGKVVLYKSEVMEGDRVNISNLPKGLYVLHFTMDNQIYSKKLVINQ